MGSFWDVWGHMRAHWLGMTDLHSNCWRPRSYRKYETWSPSWHTRRSLTNTNFPGYLQNYWYIWKTHLYRRTNTEFQERCIITGLVEEDPWVYPIKDGIRPLWAKNKKKNIFVQCQHLHLGTNLVSMEQWAYKVSNIKIKIRFRNYTYSIVSYIAGNFY